MKQACFTIMLAVNAVSVGICGAGFWHLSARVDRIFEIIVQEKIQLIGTAYADEIKEGGSSCRDMKYQDPVQQ